MGVRVIAKSFLVAWLVVALAWLPAARAENPAPDSDQSARLSDFLHSHHLPLVGAQVLNSSGGQSVLLYGYTATELGKSNAEKRTRLFLKDSEVPITNRIRVRPELASMHSPSAAPPPASAAPPGPAPPASAGIPPESGEMGGVDSYQNQQSNDAQQQYANQQAQQYQNQQAQQYMNQQNSWASTLIPLIGMGLAIGLGGGGSGFGMGVQPGFGSSNPYGGYGNPYGGGYGGPGNPYGNPYAPSPYGAPGGGSPYP